MVNMWFHFHTGSSCTDVSLHMCLLSYWSVVFSYNLVQGSSGASHAEGPGDEVGQINAFIKEPESLWAIKWVDLDQLWSHRGWASAITVGINEKSGVNSVMRWHQVKLKGQRWHSSVNTRQTLNSCDTTAATPIKKKEKKKEMVGRRMPSSSGNSALICDDGMCGFILRIEFRIAFHSVNYYTDLSYLIFSEAEPSQNHPETANEDMIREPEDQNFVYQVRTGGCFPSLSRARAGLDKTRQCGYSAYSKLIAKRWITNIIKKS